MKNILILGAGVIVVLAIGFFMLQPKAAATLPTGPTGDTNVHTTVPDENARMAEPNSDSNSNGVTKPIGGKLKAEVFTGKLEKVDTGCFADGECFVEVDGTHVTVLLGRNQEVVGKIIGVESMGDLEGHIGEEVEVYAQDNSDGTFTLYGSEGFYIKLK